VSGESYFILQSYIIVPSYSIFVNPSPLPKNRPLGDWLEKNSPSSSIAGLGGLLVGVTLLPSFHAFYRVP